MSELKRLYGKKTLLLIAALVIINMGLFMLSCAPDRKITMTGRELKSYLSEYPKFLENAKKNGENMSVLNMYKSGFASDNIKKSAEAYSSLDNIQVKYGDNRGVVLLFQYSLTDILLLAFLLIMSLQFFSERKKGLVNLIRSTQRGRGILYFQRIAILAASAFVMGILLYGGNLAGMLMKFGSGRMSRTIQSLPEFMECPYNLTIGGYFLLSCFLKITASFMCAMAFFMVMSLLGNAAAYTIAALFTVLEILLYTLIPSVSSVNMLKFINAAAIINCIDFLSVCRNLNIFGTAVPALRCNIIFMSFSIVFLIAAGYVIHGKMHVKNKKLFEKILNRLGAFFERISFQRTLLGWESFKLLIKQGGLFFMAAAFMLTFFSAIKYSTVYPVNVYEKGYYEKYQGVITRTKLAEARNEYNDIQKRIDHYQEAIDQILAKGDKYLKDNIPEQNRLGRLQSAQQEYIMKKEGMIPVLRDIHDGYKYTKRNCRTVNLIKPYTYDLLINKDTQAARHASLYILIGIIGAVSGIYAYDRQNNMRNTLNSSFRGRRVLSSAKIMVVFIVCALLSISLHLIQVFQVGKLMGYNDIGVPVQSLSFMREFTPGVSIAGYLVMLFAVRVFAAFGVGLICTVISRLCADTMAAMGISIFLLAVPAVFSEMIPNGNALSCVYFISGEYFK